jgi:hypothetical protein
MPLLCMVVWHTSCVLCMCTYTRFDDVVCLCGAEYAVRLRRRVGCTAPAGSTASTCGMCVRAVLDGTTPVRLVQTVNVEGAAAPSVAVSRGLRCVCAAATPAAGQRCPATVVRTVCCRSVCGCSSTPLDGERHRRLSDVGLIDMHCTGTPIEQSCPHWSHIGINHRSDHTSTLETAESATVTCV